MKRNFDRGRTTVFRLLLTGGVLLSGCHHRTDQPPVESEQPVAVKVTIVKAAAQEQVLSFSGTTEAAELANIGFMVAGRVQEVNFQEGAYIGEGQTVATIDPSDYNLAVRSARADLNKAGDEYQRLKLMYDRGSLTPSDFQTATRALENARAQYQEQNNKLSYTRLQAPFSGTLVRRGAEPGMVVGQGTPVFVLARVQPIKVVAAVPESEISKVKAGVKAQIHVDALDAEYAGEISATGAAADPATRQYTATVWLANPNRQLRPGMVAEIKVASGRQVSFLTLPGDAVLHDPAGSAYVYVIDTKAKKAFKRLVSTGKLTGDELEIASGLKPGETVVTGGQQKLQDANNVQY